MFDAVPSLPLKLLLPHHPHHIQVDAVCDIVHLGLNSANQDAARAAAGLLRARLLSTTGGASLLPGQALDLLGTAVERFQDEQPRFTDMYERSPMSVLKSIVASLRDSSSLDAVSPAQLMPMLQHAVQLDAAALHSRPAPSEGCRRVTRIAALAEQPAVKQLTPAQLVALLEVAVAADDGYNYCILLEAPKKQQPLPAVQLHLVDAAAVDAAAVDAAAVAALMELAVKAAARPRRTESGFMILQHLWHSRAGQRLQEDGCQPLLPVLLAAISGWPDEPSSVTGSVGKHMVSLSRSDMSSTVLLELLTAALQAGKQQAFVDLWESSGWQAKSGLNGADVGQLLRSAAMCSKCMFIAVKKLLRKHAAWRDVSAEDFSVARQFVAN
jgi:hypothetical protein